MRVNTTESTSPLLATKSVNMKTNDTSLPTKPANNLPTNAITKKAQGVKELLEEEQESESNVKKETAVATITSNNEHEQLISSSSLLIYESSLEEYEHPVNNINSSNNFYYSKINKSELEVMPSSTKASTTSMTVNVNNNETTLNDYKTIKIDTTQNASHTLENSELKSTINVNSKSAPVITDTSSPESPLLLTTSVYTAAALHGKRLPPSRQRSNYSASLASIISSSNSNSNNNCNKNNKNDNSNHIRKLMLDNNLSQNSCPHYLPTAFHDDNNTISNTSTNYNNNDNNKNIDTTRDINGKESTNSHELNYGDVVANNGEFNSQIEKNDKASFPAANKEFRPWTNFMEVECTTAEPYTNDTTTTVTTTTTNNNKKQEESKQSQDNITVESIANNHLDENTNATHSTSQTHCNTHLKHTNLYINLPSSFVRSSQLCDSEVDSVITFTSTSNSNESFCSDFSNSSSSGSNRSSNNIVEWDNNNYRTRQNKRRVSKKGNNNIFHNSNWSCNNYCCPNNNNNNISSSSSNDNVHSNIVDNYHHHLHRHHLYHNYCYCFAQDCCGKHCNTEESSVNAHEDKNNYRRYTHNAIQKNERCKKHISHLPCNKHHHFVLCGRTSHHTSHYPEPLSYYFHSHSAPTHYQRYNNEHVSSWENVMHHTSNNERHENTVAKNSNNNNNNNINSDNDNHNNKNNYASRSRSSDVISSLATITTSTATSITPMTATFSPSSSLADNITSGWTRNANCIGADNNINHNAKKEQNVNACTHSSTVASLTTSTPFSLSLDAASKQQQKNNNNTSVTKMTPEPSQKPNGKSYFEYMHKCTPLSPHSSPQHPHTYHKRIHRNVCYLNHTLNEHHQEFEMNSCEQSKEKQTVLEEVDKLSCKTNDNLIATPSRTKMNNNKHKFHIEVPTPLQCSFSTSTSSASASFFLPSSSLSTCNDRSHKTNITTHATPSELTSSHHSHTLHKNVQCTTRANYTNFMHSEFNAVEVLPGLYLGTRVDATDLQLLREHNISLVINVSEDCPVAPPELSNALHIRVLQFPLKDHSDEVIAPYFVPITEIIHEQLHRRQAYEHYVKQQQQQQEQQHDDAKIKCNEEEQNGIRNSSLHDIPDTVKVHSSLVKEDKVTSNHSNESGKNTEEEEEEQEEEHNKMEESNNTLVTNQSQPKEGAAHDNTATNNSKDDIVDLLKHYLTTSTTSTTTSTTTTTSSSSCCYSSTSEGMKTLPCLPSHWPHVDARDCGGVLIHCRMGVSRSASFVLAYLILYGTALATLTHPSSLFNTLPFMEKELAERVGGKATWGDAFESWVNSLEDNNNDKTIIADHKVASDEPHLSNLARESSLHHEDNKVMRSDKETQERLLLEQLNHDNHTSTMKEQKCKEEGYTRESDLWPEIKSSKHDIPPQHSYISAQCVNDEDKYKKLSIRNILRQLMTTSSQSKMEASCSTPKAKAAYNCISCWLLRQRRQEWALAKHVLMGHSRTVVNQNNKSKSSSNKQHNSSDNQSNNNNNNNNNNINKNSSFISCTSSTSSISEIAPEESCTTHHISLHQESSLEEEESTLLLSSSSPSLPVHIETAPHSCNTGKSSCTLRSPRTMFNNESANGITDTTNASNHASNFKHSNPIEVAELQQSRNNKPAMTSEVHLDCSRKTNVADISNTALKRSEAVLSYSTRRKLKQALQVHQRESYYGHDALCDNALRSVPHYQLNIHSSFTAHTSTPLCSYSSCSCSCSCSCSSASPKSVTLPLHVNSNLPHTYNNNNNNNSNISTSLYNSPVFPCLHSSQAASSPQLSISSPLSSFASPLTEQTKRYTFQDNILRSTLRPPYLEIVSGMTYREAFEFLKSKKHDISPNIGFVLALRELAAGGDFSRTSSNESLRNKHVK